MIETILFSFILFAAALALLGIGWLITGKAKISPGACGRAPNQKRDKDCGTNANCELCKKEKSDDDSVQPKESGDD